MSPTFRDRLEWVGVQVARRLAARLPLHSSLRLGRAIGRGAYHIGSRRRVSRNNLAHAFGEGCDAAALDEVCRDAFASLGMTLMEFLALQRHRDFYTTTLEWHGVEHFDNARRAGRGAIIASAHFANWEVLGAAAAGAGYPVTFVAQRLRNPAVNDLVRRVREQAGLHVLDRGMALRRVAQELDNNRLVCLMCDQDARRRGIFVSFFGRPASTHKGPAQLALRHGVPFIPLFGRRLADGRHRLDIYPPLVPLSGVDEESQVRDLMQRFHVLLEDVVRGVPSQYLWMHRRWKTQPPQGARDASQTPPPTARAEARLRRHTST